jgi:secretion/DNA translocation related TadE-like protein
VSLWAVVLALVAVAGIVLASALAARTRVDAAADLSALAGASAILAGPTEVCARARSIALDNGATLVSCAVSGAAVRVQVVAPAPRPVGWLLPDRSAVLRSRAHAELTAEP